MINRGNKMKSLISSRRNKRKSSQAWLIKRRNKSR